MLLLTNDFTRLPRFGEVFTFDNRPIGALFIVNMRRVAPIVSTLKNAVKTTRFTKKCVFGEKTLAKTYIMC